MSRACELGLLCGLLLAAELLGALMPAGGGGSSPPAGAGDGGGSPELAETLAAEAGIGAARKPAPPMLLVLLLGLRAAMDAIKPPPVPLEAIGLTLMVSPAFKLKSCCGAAAMAELPAAPCRCFSQSDSATLKSKASSRSGKPMPRKAWRMEVASATRTTKLRLLSAAGSTHAMRSPTRRGHIANSSPL